MRVEEVANKLDSANWKSLRPVPLSIEETKDYHEKDSVERIKNTKTFKDSIDSKNNIFKISNAFLGYTYRNSHKRRRFSFSPLFKYVQYNTVEGGIFNPDLLYEKYYENGKSFKVHPYFRYGFANKHFNSKLEIDFNYNPKRWAYLKLAGGKFVSDFNAQEAITPFINSVYTLFYRRNYLKIYEKVFFSFQHGRELINGIYFNLGGEYAIRTKLQNSTDFSIYTNRSIAFTPNNSGLNNADENSKALLFNADIKFTFKQKYITYPNFKIGSGSRYPTLAFSYKKGIHGLFYSDVNYDFLASTMEYKINLKQKGKVNLELQGGGFINNRSLFFVDYKHFNGNQTIFSRSNLKNSFWLLDYYAFSTNNYFIEAHWDHHLNGFITHTIPYLNALNWQFVNTINFLYTPQLKNYLEIGLGMEHIFKYFRVDYTVGISENIPLRHGVKIGMGF